MKENDFDASGLSESEAGTLKIEAETLTAILAHSQAGLSACGLASLLDEHPSLAGNLLQGRIAQVSTEK